MEGEQKKRSREEENGRALTKEERSNVKKNYFPQASTDSRGSAFLTKVVCIFRGGGVEACPIAYHSSFPPKQTLCSPIHPTHSTASLNRPLDLFMLGYVILVYSSTPVFNTLVDKSIQHKPEFSIPPLSPHAYVCLNNASLYSVVAMCIYQSTSFQFGTSFLKMDLPYKRSSSSCLSTLLFHL